MGRINRYDYHQMTPLNSKSPHYLYSFFSATAIVTITSTAKTLAVIAISAIAILACSEKVDLPPAPLDSKTGLESLATAYEKESNKLPVSPIKMRPSIRKQFVNDVFKAANFSYTKTLESFLHRVNPTNSKNVKDLAELLSLPHKNIDAKSRIELYSERELAAIDKIDEVLGQK